MSARLESTQLESGAELESAVFEYQSLCWRMRRGSFVGIAEDDFEFVRVASFFRLFQRLNSTVATAFDFG